MRKLVTIRKIDEIRPIEGADAIEVAILGGWQVVIKKGSSKVGDLVAYAEIDSWIPTDLAPFLSKGKDPKEFEGVKGERLRTVKLRGQISQGLLIDLFTVAEYCKGVVTSDGIEVENRIYSLDDDITDLLGVKKWEASMPAQLAGQVKGNFPSLIPKTDQERVQNISRQINEARTNGVAFTVEEKLEGSSMTCYLIDGAFGVCSRNLDLKRDEANSFWQVAIEQNIEQRMRDAGCDNFAIQGELIGPGIQKNIYKLSKLDFYVFDVYDIKAGKYLTPSDRRHLVDILGLKNVPVLETGVSLGTMQEIIDGADGESVLCKTLREGVVYKANDGSMTFKSISGEYLSKEK